MQHNARPFPRYKRRLTVRFGHSHKEMRHGFTRNLSASGMFVESRHIEPPGQRLDIELELPGQGTIELVGQVVWGRTVGRGLERVAAGGFGVQVIGAPEAWYRFCMTLGEPARS